jgi:hypothetical protein
MPPHSVGCRVGLQSAPVHGEVCEPEVSSSAFRDIRVRPVAQDAGHGAQCAGWLRGYRTRLSMGKRPTLRHIPNFDPSMVWDLPGGVIVASWL